MTLRALVGLFIAGVAGCSPTSRRGTLMPVGSAGISLVSTHGLPNDTARLDSAGTTVDVTGRWSDQGETLEMRYRSAHVPASLQVASTSTWKGHAAAASAAWDRSVGEPGNAIGRPLLGAGTLQLAQDQAKLIQIEYNRPGLTGRAIGDEISFGVPTPEGSRSVSFRVSGE